MNPLLVSVSQAAKALNVHRCKVYRFFECGLPYVILPGSRVRKVAVEDLREFASKHRITTEAVNE